MAKASQPPAADERLKQTQLYVCNTWIFCNSHVAVVLQQTDRVDTSQNFLTLNLMVRIVTIGVSAESK